MLDGADEDIESAPIVPHHFSILVEGIGHVRVLDVGDEAKAEGRRRHFATLVISPPQRDLNNLPPNTRRHDRGLPAEDPRAPRKLRAPGVPRLHVWRGRARDVADVAAVDMDLWQRFL